MRDRRNTLTQVSSALADDSITYAIPRISFSEKLCSTSPPSSPILSLTDSRATIPRHTTRFSFLRFLKWMAFVGIIAFFHSILRESASSFLGFNPFAGDEVSFSGMRSTNETFSDSPGVLVVSDRHGVDLRWTVMIPRNSSFPLSGHEYAELCEQCSTVPAGLMQKSRLFQGSDWTAKLADGYETQRYLDVGRAEELGVLPKSADGVEGGVCETSLTFVFDADEASFGKTLLLLWLSYGLAKKDGRAFFMDDSQWPWGSYTSYFQPLSAQGCVQPPPSHIVPCPRNAKHLIVSSATAPWFFGPAFDREYSNIFRNGIERFHKIFDLIRTGYEDLFHLNDEDAAYAVSRVAQIRENTSIAPGSIIGIHIRRGDLHPLEYQFSSDYLPLERYVNAARQLSTTISKSATQSKSSIATVLVVSDDPLVIESTDLQQSAYPIPLQRAQDRIQLGTKASLDKAAAPSTQQENPSIANPTDQDDNAGWEGGFYKSIFLSLGKPVQRSAQTGLEEAGVSAQGFRLRQFVGRAYLLDLAVLVEADAVVCAVSSASCRVLGVMMGWDRVGKGEWLNVDDGRSWSWDAR